MSVNGQFSLSLVGGWVSDRIPFGLLNNVKQVPIVLMLIFRPVWFRNWNSKPIKQKWIQVLHFLSCTFLFFGAIQSTQLRFSIGILFICYRMLTLVIDNNLFTNAWLEKESIAPIIWLQSQHSDWLSKRELHYGSFSVCVILTYVPYKIDLLPIVLLLILLILCLCIYMHYSYYTFGCLSLSSTNNNTRRRRRSIKEIPFNVRLKVLKL